MEAQALLNLPSADIPLAKEPDLDALQKHLWWGKQQNKKIKVNYYMVELAYCRRTLVGREWKY